MVWIRGVHFWRRLRAIKAIVDYCPSGATWLRGRRIPFWEALSDGYDGLVYCPSAGRGNCDFDSVGWALQHLADYLKDELHRDRVYSFRVFLEIPQRAFPRSDRPFQLIRIVDKFPLPIWARQMLPEFFVKLSSLVHDPEREVAIVPRSWATVLATTGYATVHKPLLKDYLAKISYKEEDERIVWSCSQEFRNVVRLPLPLENEAQVAKVEDHVLQQLRDYMPELSDRDVIKFRRDATCVENLSEALAHY